MVELRMAGAGLPVSLSEVVDYRKSGLSLNHIVGCPLDCGYCVRHLFDNFDMKKPHLVMSDDEAVNRLLNHWAFQPGITPIQIFNRATDPFLPGVKDHLFACLEELDSRELTNPVLVITRWHITAHDVARLEQLENLKLTILVTWSGINDERIEPVDSAIAERSLQILHKHARRTKSIFYWRPIIAGLNDTQEHLHRARAIAGLADATVFTGLFYRSQIKEYFESVGVPDLYEATARRKILPHEVEQKIIAALHGTDIFRKTSCGVAFAHGIADYNGHYGVREICNICPQSQLGICESAHARPDESTIALLAEKVGLDASEIVVDDRRVQVVGSSEQQRYYMQHALNYQVHDQSQPHYFGRHGRADLGWV